MQLNFIEMLAMNNPLRKGLLRHLEFRLFRQLLADQQVDPSGKTLVDLACGSGYSSYFLAQTYRPNRLVACDVMPRQLELARRYPTEALWVLADVHQLGLKPESFDFAFAFGLLHHLEDWRRAAAEIAGLLKPGGYLLIEEPNGTSAAFFRRVFGFGIPPEGAFNFDQLEARFAEVGLKRLAWKKVLFPCFRAYILQKI
ncbi:MAG: class I SAM-dependent methyltransferase [bacterium]|nr:class I SAM-dependent methyltransferase [bacterium]